MTKSPLVSIIVPTYNSATTLNACLASITNQSYKHIELIVVDNNSTDNTQKIARKYTKHVYNKGPERSWQRNYGVNICRGDYVMMIDSDMELDPAVTSECVEKFKDKKVVGVIIPEESFGIGFWAQCKKLERSYYVGVDSIEAARCFPTVIYKELGGYDTDMVSGEDWDLSQRAAKLGILARIDVYIMHNEGHLKLGRTLKKKYYYASLAAGYLDKTNTSSPLTSEQGPLKRYKMFLSRPGMLFRQPHVGIGMLSMKTAEYVFGAVGYLKNRTEKSKNQVINAPREKRILFIGTHGQRNIGDELLLKTFMNELKDSADIFYVNSYLPDETRDFLKDYNVKVFNTRSDRLKLLINMVRCDAVVFGGGSIIKELYTSYGGDQYGTLRVIDQITMVAKLVNKPIFMSHIGVGPLDTKNGIRMARRILKRAELVTTRDSQSYALLKLIDPSIECRAATDAVFSISLGDFSNSIKKPSNDSIVIGLNLCRNIQNDSNWQLFINTLAKDIIQFVNTSEKEITILGIPMQTTGEKTDDTNTLLKFKHYIQTKTSQEVDFLIATTKDYDDVTLEILKCDVVIAERLHMLILGAILGVPLVPLAYDPKVAGVMTDLGLDDILIDINHRFPKGLIRQRLVDNLSSGNASELVQIARLHEQARLAFEGLKQRLYEL